MAPGRGGGGLDARVRVLWSCTLPSLLGASREVPRKYARTENFWILPAERPDSARPVAGGRRVPRAVIGALV